MSDPIKITRHGVEQAEVLPGKYYVAHFPAGTDKGKALGQMQKAHPKSFFMIKNAPAAAAEAPAATATPEKPKTK